MPHIAAEADGVAAATATVADRAAVIRLAKWTDATRRGQLDGLVTVCKLRGNHGILVFRDAAGNAMELDARQHYAESERAAVEAELARKAAMLGSPVFPLHTFKYERSKGAPLAENRVRVMALLVQIGGAPVVVAYGATRDQHLVLSGSKLEPNGEMKALGAFQPTHTPEASVRAWSAGKKAEAKRFRLVVRGAEAFMEYLPPAPLTVVKVLRPRAPQVQEPQPRPQERRVKRARIVDDIDSESETEDEGEATAREAATNVDAAPRLALTVATRPGEPADVAVAVDPDIVVDVAAAAAKPFWDPVFDLAMREGLA